ARGTHGGASQSSARARDDRVRGRVRAQDMKRRARCDTEPPALAGCEPPEAVVAAELGAALVDDRPLLRGEPGTREKVAVVRAREEAGFLALGAVSGGETGALRFRARFLLRLLSQREPDPVEQARIHAGEHVRLILVWIGG